MLIILDDWTGMLEYGGQIDVIYTDFEKAFNRVPHNRLISKFYIVITSMTISSNGLKPI